MPEGNLAGTDVGIRQIAGSLSLEGLTQLSLDGRVLPRLAESWTWEEGGLRLKVNLRPGVTFHDGTPMTAPLMVDVLNTALSRPLNRAQHPSFRHVTAVRATGNLQLTLELTQPAAFLPEDLEVPLGIKSQTVGTGPFRVVQTDDSQAELHAFESYHSGAPQIDAVILRPFPTLRTAWTSLLRDEIDMVMNVPPDAVDFVRNDEVQVVSFARNFQFLVAFNSERRPLNSPVVRRALNVAINREEIVKKVFQGNAVPSTGPLSPQHWAYDKSVSAYGYDPGLATLLLDNAGLRSDSNRTSGAPPARFQFTCLIPANFSLIERVALEVQRQLYNVGVDMRFDVVPIEEFDIRVREQRFEAMLIDMVSGPTIGRADIFWRSAKQFRGFNVFGFENPEAERLFGMLRASTNEAAVRSAISGLQRVLMEDPPALFIAWDKRTRAIRRDFTIVNEPGRDPVDTIWRWAPAINPRQSAKR